MSKIKIFIAFLLLLPDLLYAQTAEGGWLFDIGISMPSVYYQYEDYFGITDCFDKEYDSSLSKSFKDIDRNCYKLFATPTISVRAMYMLSDRFYAVSSIGYNHFTIRYCNPFTDKDTGKENTFANDFLIGGRYLAIPCAHFYIQALFGVATHGSADFWSRNAESKERSALRCLPDYFAFQISGGFYKYFGDRVFISGEFGFGTEHFSELGGRIGVGYKL